MQPLYVQPPPPLLQAPSPRSRLYPQVVASPGFQAPHPAFHPRQLTVPPFRGTGDRHDLGGWKIAWRRHMHCWWLILGLAILSIGLVKLYEDARSEVVETTCTVRKDEGELWEEGEDGDYRFCLSHVTTPRTGERLWLVRKKTSWEKPCPESFNCWHIRHPPGVHTTQEQHGYHGLQAGDLFGIAFAAGSEEDVWADKPEELYASTHAAWMVLGFMLLLCLLFDLLVASPTADQYAPVL